MMINKPFSYSRLSRGFTLVEIMIVVVIIGILVAIALPQYTSYVEKTHRADTKAAILKLQQMLERSYTDRGAYNTDIATLIGVTSTTIVTPAHQKLGFSSPRFQLTIVGTGTDPTKSPTYTISAGILTPYKDSLCQSFGINSAGVKLPETPTPTNSCW